MGLPSGTLWSRSDIDVTKENGFTDTPFTYEKSFFSWGNVDGHNPTSENSFSPWNWGGVNADQPFYEGQVYGNTPGNTLVSNIPVDEEYDAARANLGAPWRLPSSDDFDELLNNIIFINADGTEVDPGQADKRVVINGIRGIFLESRINGNRLFFSASGYGSEQLWGGHGSYGYYLSSTFYSDRDARCLSFVSGGVNPSRSYGRHIGYAIRPVMDASQ